MPPGNPHPETPWVYRQAELVLGPVPATALEEMLLAGTLSGQTEVAPAGSSAFQPLAQVECFRLVVAKAEAKLRVEAAARAEQEARRRRRTVQLSVLGGLALVAVVGAATAARHVAARASLGAEEGGTEISMEPPVIRPARAEAGLGEELLEYGSGDGARTAAAPTTPAARTTGAERPRRAGGSPGAGERLATAGEDGLQTGAFDQEAINAVVAQRQRTLYPCLKEAAEENPDVGGRVPIEFVIGNDGRVTKVWVDRNELKRGGLQACLLRELQKWQFPPQAGERPAVSLVFNLGRRG